MKKLGSILLIMLLCCGLMAGCGDDEVEAPDEVVEQNAGDEQGYAESEEDNEEMVTSDNDVLPHDNSLKLSDTKDTIASKEILTENEYGIDGVWDSSTTWHVENSNYDISYHFEEDGSIGYVTYLLVDSSLSDVELGFTEVTTKSILWDIYGQGDGPWKINSNGNEYTVSLEKSDEDHSIILTIMKY